MENIDRPADGPSSVSSPARSARPLDLALLAVAAGIFFFAALGARDLWNPNEPIYGRAVAEMAARGDWVVPTVNGMVFAEKPILYYWSALAAARLHGGIDELSLRLPSALAGVLSVLLTYLLVLPYGGRRRALISAALFATLYQVFWAARAVQMDILVLASALGVMVPLTRLLDFGARPWRCWTLAGLAAGLGFAAKGPVALIVPGLAIGLYALSTGRLRRLLHLPALGGAAVALAVSAPWYLLLWLRGDTAFLYEVLLRQNVGRFVDAWDHVQPWWYYLEYLFIDYAPWAWLLPAAWLTAARDRDEERLHRLSWIWIVGVVAFFSLSESKRAPYILPIAPAVAALAGGVVERLIADPRYRRPARLAATTALGVLALALAAGGVVLLAGAVEVPAELTTLATPLGLVLAATGFLVIGGLAVGRRRPGLAPTALFGGVVVLYLTTAVWAFPAADPLKSARAFAGELNGRLASTGGTVASYRFTLRRAGYAYYADRSIPILDDAHDLRAFWQVTDVPYVIVEEPDDRELRTLLDDAAPVYRARIGSRTAYLFTRATTVAER